MKRCFSNAKWALLMALCLPLLQPSAATAQYIPIRPQDIIPSRPEDVIPSIPNLPSGFTGYKSNKPDKMNEVRAGGWVVAFSDDISETDAAQGVVAGGVSIYAGNPGPFIAWVDALVNRTVSSLSADAQRKFTSAARSQAEKLAAEVIKAAISGRSQKEVFRQFDTIDFKAGAIKYSGRNYAAGQAVGPPTWGLKPYIAFRVRGSGSSNSSSSGSANSGSASMRNYTIRNDSRYTVTLVFSPTGNTARLAPGQSTTARSPLQNGEDPKVKATASNGAWWERTIRNQNGEYRVVNTENSKIQIVP